MQNVSFQGKSNLFFSKEIISHSQRLAKSTSRHINPKNNTCNISRGKIFTSDINKSDFTVIVKDNERGFLTNVPIYRSLSESIHDIGLRLADLQSSTKEKLTAWIIGGSHSSVDNYKTMDALNEVAEVLCDKPNIDTSILSGLKANAYEDIFAMHNNKNSTQIAISAKNIEELENMFEVVELNNVEIFDKQLNMEMAKKAFNVKEKATVV